MAKEPDGIEDLPAPSMARQGGGGGGGNPFIPILAVLILVPVITVTLFEFYIFPKFQHSMEAITATVEAAQGEAHGGEGKGKQLNAKRGEIVQSYAFDNIVANLSGSLQSRYLKVSFTLESQVADFTGIMEKNKPKVIDAALGVLSQLTIQDLEKAGFKNIIRSDLLNAIGRVLNGNIVDQLYFSEFVVQ
jgi:flagellar FliL protein